MPELGEIICTDIEADLLVSDVAAWTHFMCERCWFNTPGNTIYAPRGITVGVFVPLQKARVEGRKVYICCVCDSPCTNPSKFEEDPEGIFCEHREDGTVPFLDVLYKRKENGNVQRQNIPE